MEEKGGTEEEMGGRGGRRGKEVGERGGCEERT